MASIKIQTSRHNQIDQPDVDQPSRRRKLAYGLGLIGVHTLYEDLGEGRHFGEWFGQGIQRTYGMKRKMFALFNTTRWMDKEFETDGVIVVPELYRGPIDNRIIELTMRNLKENGSFVTPFDRPEGIVIYHTAARTMFKKTFEKDQEGKGE